MVGVLSEYAAPLGVCRQVMMEFCNPDTFQIILATGKEQYEVFTLRGLLPLGFGPDNLAETMRKPRKCRGTKAARKWSKK